MVVRVHPMPQRFYFSELLPLLDRSDPIIHKIFLALQSVGIVAEWLGAALQKLVQRFESARCLKGPTLRLGFFLAYDFNSILDIKAFFWKESLAYQYDAT